MSLRGAAGAAPYPVLRPLRCAARRSAGAVDVRRPSSRRSARASDGKDAIFARGVGDDKGQLMTFLEASRSWLTVHGSLPFRLTVMIEGDEERRHRPSRPLPEGRTRVNFPSMRPSFATPACGTRRRRPSTPGCAAASAIEVTVIGPKIDLHSGLYGGPVQNPIKVLSRILAAIHDKQRPHHHPRLL